jgi:metallo-beta-lactamase family protein
MTIDFWGGAKMVTGANYLLTAGEEKFLVDCGLYQSSYYCERKNFEPFSYDPREIKAVLVTHAHIDHTGRLPKLYKDGFRGVVYSTPPTKDFARELLLDSEGILRREAEREKVPPLYGQEEVEGLLKLWQTVDYHQTLKLGGLRVTLVNAGHVLGSSSIIFEAEGKTIVFSGDLGNRQPPLIKEWEPLTVPADYCVIESAYGDRLHEDFSRRKEILEDVIEDTIKAGGVLMIPAFAMERIQVILSELNELVENGRIPQVPVFVDSPLAIKLTAVYRWYDSYFNEEAWKKVSGDKSLLSFPGLRLSFNKEDSQAIKDVPPPKIVIAGSGMSQGGRITFHEKEYLPDPKSTLLLIGYQTVGSLGRKILDGAKSVRIFGEEIPVRCKVAHISGYSAHADQARLLDWLRPMRGTLKKAFVVQGDEGVVEVFASVVRDRLAIETYVPSEGEKVVLQ